jgi:hypothetical protein
MKVWAYKGLNFSPPVALETARRQFDQACADGNRVCLVHKACDVERSRKLVAKLKDSAPALHFAPARHNDIDTAQLVDHFVQLDATGRRAASAMLAALVQLQEQVA